MLAGPADSSETTGTITNHGEARSMTYTQTMTAASAPAFLGRSLRAQRKAPTVTVCAHMTPAVQAGVAAHQGATGTPTWPRHSGRSELRRARNNDPEGDRPRDPACCTGQREAPGLAHSESYAKDWFYLRDNNNPLHTHLSKAMETPATTLLGRGTTQVTDPYRLASTEVDGPHIEKAASPVWEFDGL